MAFAQLEDLENIPPAVIQNIQYREEDDLDLDEGEESDGPGYFEFDVTDEDEEEEEVVVRPNNRRRPLMSHRVTVRDELENYSPAEIEEIQNNMTDSEDEEDMDSDEEESRASTPEPPKTWVSLEMPCLPRVITTSSILAMMMKAFTINPDTFNGLQAINEAIDLEFDDDVDNDPRYKEYLRLVDNIDMPGPPTPTEVKEVVMDERDVIPEPDNIVTIEAYEEEDDDYDSDDDEEEEEEEEEEESRESTPDEDDENMITIE